MVKRIILITVGGLVFCSTCFAVEFYVTADGNDSNPGTKAKPFKTLEAARDAIRALKIQNPPPRAGPPSAEKSKSQGGITVWLRGGIYERAKAFELGSQDSGTAAAPICYRACPGEKVRISGGKSLPLSAFKPVTDEAMLQRLDPAARGKVLQVDLKAQGITDFGQMQARGGTSHGLVNSGLELFFNDEPMTLARWPNQGFAMTGRILDIGIKHRCIFAFPDERIKRWAKADDLWVHGYWGYDWSDEYLPIQSVDAEKQQITLGQSPHYNLKEGKRFYVLNLVEELDQLGEWYLDRKTGILYFWPPEPMRKANIVVSVADEPLVFLKDVSHVTLRGVIVEAGRSCGVRILGGAENLVAGCTLRNLGTYGAHIGEGFQYTNTVHDTQGGLSNGVQSCEIYHTGQGGIILAGGDRKTLQPAGNFAVNNDIHHWSRIDRTYRVAVDLAGVGNLVAHNRIHDAPHTGIIFWANDCVMEYNEIYNLCQETDDAGAFYIGRDLSMRGNVIRYNLIRDIGHLTIPKGKGLCGTTAIYLDDLACGSTVYGNVIVNVYRGVLIGSGSDNIVENNLWVNCSKAAVEEDARGLSWAKAYFDGRDPTLFNRLKAVNYRQPPYSTHYPALAKDDNPAMPKGNRIERNVCVCSIGLWVDLRDKLDEKAAGVGTNNLIVPDAGFVDPAKGNYRLRDDSPVWRKLPGFQPIPFEKIGLYEDEYRKDLPAK